MPMLFSMSAPIRNQPIFNGRNKMQQKVFEVLARARILHVLEERMEPKAREESAG